MEPWRCRAGGTEVHIRQNLLSKISTLPKPTHFSENASLDSTRIVNTSLIIRDAIAAGTYQAERRDRLRNRG